VGVPEKSILVVFGVVLGGSGQLALDDLKLEATGADANVSQTLLPIMLLDDPNLHSAKHSGKPVPYR